MLGRFLKTNIIDDLTYNNKKNEERIKKYAKKEKEKETITLTPRQIEVISKISAGKNFDSKSKDYEILQKLVKSLEKSRFSEIGLL